MKSYSELSRIDNFMERYEYLRVGQGVADLTFNGRRILNQYFYKSKKWQEARARAILRDEACDLGILDRKLDSKIIVHHINPLTIEQVEHEAGCLYDLDNLICCSLTTHNAIHYGDEGLLIKEHVDRQPNDTIPWG